RRPDLDFTIPSIAPADGTFQGGTLIDNLPDGRLLLITTRDQGSGFGTAEIRLESAAGSHAFGYVADLPLPATDAIWWNPGGFLKVSQSTGLAAVGNSSYSVGVFDTAQLGSLSSSLWYDNFGSYLDPIGDPVAVAAWGNGT